MKRRKPSLFKRLRWRAEWLAFLVVERLIALVPLDTLWRAGAALSVLGRLFAGRWPIVRNNLRTVLGPDTPDEEIAARSRDVFRHTVANLLTALKGAHLPAHQVRDVITYSNEDIGERAHAQGKGVIVISAHMGNFELLTQGLGAFRPELKVAGIYRPLNNIYLDKVLRDRRANRGMTLFAKLTAYHAPIKWVRSGGVLGIIADQRAGRHGSITPFFGRLMSMSPLPVFVHKHTGAPVIGVSMKTTSPGKWHVTFHAPDLEDGESFTTAHMAGLLEKMINESIVDVFWMQNLWRMNERRPLELRGREGPLRLTRHRDRPLYPFAVLVRVPDESDRFQDTVPALRALAASRPDMAVHLLARESLRPTATDSGVPHTFHALEDDRLPDRVRNCLRAGFVLTEAERPGRDLAQHFSGPIYSLPSAEQAIKNWRLAAPDPKLAPPDRWLEFFRILGLHEPPLTWEAI